MSLNTDGRNQPVIPSSTSISAPGGGKQKFRNVPYRPHGSRIRGADLALKSTLFEGRFGRMFRSLPGANHSERALTDLAASMTSPSEADPTPESKNDAEENVGSPKDATPAIAAGYTYLGQFIDHDLTFDPASSLQRQDDPDALTDFRTPRFDLDCLYGRGPDDQPYLYRDDGVHMLLGRKVTGSAFDPNTRDIPRNAPEGGDPQRGLIGDPRNDENTIVSQFQATMLRFHNRMADILADQMGDSLTFDRVQQEVRWHYQWLVLHDFLPTILGEETVSEVLPQVFDDSKIGQDPHLNFYKFRQDPFMPVEFSVAAYRFGHSMVRPIYRLNTTMSSPGDGRLMIFPSNPRDLDNSLTGFRAFPSDHAVDWTLFFNIDTTRPRKGKTRIQPAYKPDTSLVNPLGHLPRSIASKPDSLALRNLLRGLRMSLPSGQAVARAMGMTPLKDSEIIIGKATEAKDDPKQAIDEISAEFKGNCPLWCYVLAEARSGFRKDTTPIRLGKVGGRIIAETFVGLMTGDAHSYLRQNPFWHPREEFMRNGKFGIAELILQAKEAL